MSTRAAASLRRSPLFWTLFVVAWIGLAFVPAIHVYKGDPQDTLGWWPLGFIYFAVVDRPSDWVSFLPLAAAHAGVALGFAWLVCVLRRLWTRTDRK